MKYLKLSLGALLITIISGLNVKDDFCKNSEYILSKANKVYDANNQWQHSAINIHIQEPRVGNPQRYTKLLLNNASNYFEMERQKDIGTIKRIVNEHEKSEILVNGKSDISTEIKEKYALNLERTLKSKNFYKILYGVPMSITNELWDNIEPAQQIVFEGKEAYKIAIELKETLISKHWALLISKENYELLAIEFNHPEQPENEGEIIKFNGEYEINGMKIPRIRNWYAKGTNEYLGTDIIVTELD